MEKASRPLPSDDLDAVANSVHVPWKAFSGARLFVTGGTGFFGTWLLESLVRANETHALNVSAVVLTRDRHATLARLPHLAKDRHIEFVTGDIRQFSLHEGAFSHVIHGATSASAKLNMEHPLEMLDTIVLGTRRALDFAVKCGARRFLFLSSGAVYGPQLSEHIDESYAGAPDPLDPNSAYGQGKRLGEHLCRLYGQIHGLEFVLARCYAFVGPNLPLDAHFAIGNFLRDALAGRSVEVAGDGTPMRSYLYASDLAVWLYNLLALGQSGRAYNVGSERAVSIADLAEIVSRHVGTGAFTISKTRTPGAPVARYVPSTVRARTELGLTETVSLEDALKRTANWLSRS